MTPMQRAESEPAHIDPEWQMHFNGGPNELRLPVSSLTMGLDINSFMMKFLPPDFTKSLREGDLSDAFMALLTGPVGKTVTDMSSFIAEEHGDRVMQKRYETVERSMAGAVRELSQSFPRNQMAGDPPQEEVNFWNPFEQLPDPSSDNPKERALGRIFAMVPRWIGGPPTEGVIELTNLFTNLHGMATTGEPVKQITNRATGLRKFEQTPDVVTQVLSDLKISSAEGSIRDIMRAARMRANAYQQETAAHWASRVRKAATSPVHERDRNLEVIAKTIGRLQAEGILQPSFFGTQLMQEVRSFMSQDEAELFVDNISRMSKAMMLSEGMFSFGAPQSFPATLSDIFDFMENVGPQQQAQPERQLKLRGTSR